LLNNVLLPVFVGLFLHIPFVFLQQEIGILFMGPSRLRYVIIVSFQPFYDLFGGLVIGRSVFGKQFGKCLIDTEQTDLCIIDKF